MRILDALGDYLQSKSSVQMVADDPLLAAEMLLLVRIMFADGGLTGEELTLFKSICSETFGIPEEDVPDVIRYLRETGYETSGKQAALMFEGMSAARKQRVLSHVVSLARADLKLHVNEADLIERIAKALGYGPEQVRALL
ncbi:MAG: TerB family tellurite resistance protein [Pseudomonadota bacterium]